MEARASHRDALVKDGAIIGFEITSGGYGYTTPPTLSVPGMNGISAKVNLGFSEDMALNGAVSEITMASAN